MFQPESLLKWKISTSDMSGFHEVVSSESGLTKSLRAYRLNLKKHDSITIEKDRRQSDCGYLQ